MAEPFCCQSVDWAPSIERSIDQILAQPYIDWSASVVVRDM